MKKITILSILSLIILNLLFIPTLTTSAQVITELNSLLSAIPDNTAYFYYTPDGAFNNNDFIQDKVESMDFVENTSYQQLYQREIGYCYQSPCTDQPFSVPLEIPIVILGDSSDQLLPIIYGENLSGDGQVIVSSALVTGLGLNYEQVVGQQLESYTIVGVYQDPYSFAEYNDDVYKLPFIDWEQTPHLQTFNQAYTIDSETKERNKSSYFVNYDQNMNAILIDQKIMKITFTDDNLEQNLNNLLSLFDGDNITLVSNLTPGSSIYGNTYYYPIITTTRNLIIALVIIDIIVIGGLFALNRKEV